MKKFYYRLPMWFKLWWAKQFIYMFRLESLQDDIVLKRSITGILFNELSLWIGAKVNSSIGYKTCADFIANKEKESHVRSGSGIMPMKNIGLFNAEGKTLSIVDVMAMLPTDEILEDILMDGYEMNEKNTERMKVGKYVRDKCAEMLVGN